MRKQCINSNQKIQQRKVIQNLLFSIGKLVPLQQSMAYGLLFSSTHLSKRMAKKEVVLAEFLCFFSGKTNHIQIQKFAIKCTFSPPKGLKLQETKEKMLSTCDKWMKKKEKGNTWEQWPFQKMWGSTYPSSWWFFWTLAALGTFYLMCVHQNSFVVQMYASYTSFYWVGPLSLSGAPFYWVGPTFIEWGPLSTSKSLTFIEYL